jgi:predicted dehydrogenase/threonine dehydrogenase-like Zn-dependent dehydrogenase
MKQVLRKGLKDIVVDEVPDPMVTPHHVLVRPANSLISSGTETASIHQEGIVKEVADNPSHLRKVWDVMLANGPMRTLAEVRAKFSDYAVLGYAGAGVVAEVHPTVRDLEPGDRVAYGGEGTGHGECIITGRNLVARVPDDVPFEHACFATLGSIALNAVRIAQISLGDSVVVLGLGLVGQLIAQLARLQGAVVIATDLKPERVDLARRLGANHAIPGGAGFAEGVAAVTAGRGADCVIVAAAAKSDGPCRTALAVCRDRGRIVVVGAVEMSFPWNDMYLKEIQLFMSRAYGPGSYDPAYERQGRDYPVSYVRWTENRNMEEFLRLLAERRADVAPLITHRFPLEQAPVAYQTILDPASNSLAVVLNYPVADLAAPVTPVRRVEIPGARPATSGFRVALAGAGNISRWAHMPALKSIRDVSLRAVYSAGGARGKSYGKRFGAAYCCSDYDEILRDPEVDVVLITTRNQLHASEAARALLAGKHVFVEKPMALTEEECRVLMSAVRESGKQLTVGFNRRYAPDYLAVKRTLARRSGPAVIHARINSPGISGAYWMADPSIGGAILGEACHFTDLFYWLLESEPVSVSAYSLPTSQPDPIGENNLVSSFRFADGSIANFTYCTVGSRTSGGERVEVFAPGLGAFTEDFKRVGIRTSVSKTSSRMFAEKGYTAQMQAFFSSLREGRAPEVTVLDGARSTILALRMLEAARTGLPVELEWRSAAETP